MKQVAWRPMLAVIVMAAICTSVSIARADGNAPAAAPAATEPTAVPTPPVTNPYATSVEGGSDFEKWCQNVKKPCDWFCWGADLQLREVYENQGKYVGAPGIWDYSRYRGRVWTTISPTEDIDINARFQWEAYNQYDPESAEATTLSQGLFDQLNVNFKNLFETKSSLKVGRQDIFLGDGWLVADGTPFDGSLTGFFDAIRFTYSCENSPTTADLIFIDNHASADKYLKPIDNQYFPNAEQDEKGFIAYFTNKSVQNTDISPYFIYKDASALNNLSAHGDDIAALGYSAEIYTPGLRIAHKVDDNWRWRAEAAYQFGHREGEQISALGGNTALQYFVNDPMNNNFRLQYEYLSGDHPGSSKYEGFDVLWGRWARWSDLYADTVRRDGLVGGGDFSNLHRIGPGWSISPCDKITIDSDYYLLFADQPANVNPTEPSGVLAGRNPQDFSNNGYFRGQLIRSVLTYKFTPHISGHLQGELFLPGNYYSHSDNSVETFLRYELVLTF